MRHTLLLNGLDGSNPLAFLAALGTLRVLSGVWSSADVKMAWTIQNGVWNPALYLAESTDEATVIGALMQHMKRNIAEHPIAFMESLYGGNPAEVRKMVHDRAKSASANDRDDVDWLSAMCCELAPKATSQLQLVRRDYVWGNLKSVMRLTEAEHLRRTLLQLWDYADPLDNQSLHLEPGEDRRHAHQWHKPSGDPTRKKRGGMLGANRLAIEAYPLFQSIGLGEKLSTRGFSGNRSDNTRWTWPIWSSPIGLEVVASLLGSPDLQLEQPDTRLLRAQGVEVAYRSRRILVEKTPNFTPAMPV